MTRSYTDEWRSYIDPLISVGERMLGEIPYPDDQQLREETYRFVFSAISQAYFGLFIGDARYPDFRPNLNMAYNFGNPNPDDAYYLAPLEGAGVYKMTGFRGTVRIVDFQIGGGDFYARGGTPGPAYSHYDLDTLNIEDDGSFEVILSEQRPSGCSGNWWNLDRRSTYMLVRQRSYDWLNEIDGRLAIERIDLPAIRPRMSVDQIRTNLRQIAVWAVNWPKFMTDMVKRYRAQGLVNRLAVADLGSEGGWLGTVQQYIHGIFELAPDEALIYETEIPKKARYWNITVNDTNWCAIDYVNRQSSLNGHSAVLDKDGKFRAVISAVDPCVPNWLDTAGYAQGTIFGRWKECSSYPLPELKKVKVTEVRRYLPEDTPNVTPESRDAALRLRRKAAQLRKRW